MSSQMSEHKAKPAARGQLRVVYCRRCCERTNHSDESAQWGTMRWRCAACGLRSFDDEVEVAAGLAALALAS